MIGYKTLPSQQLRLSSDPYPGQTEKDWSAIYAQFTVSNALAYLSNNYDRGHSDVTLVTLKAKNDIKCILFKDASFSDPHLSEVDKSEKLRKALFLEG